MIVACPSCKAKFRIDEGRIRPPGVRLRCARCQTFFAVRKRVLEPTPEVTPGKTTAAAPAAGPKVLVAHESMAFLTGVSAQLEQEGYEVLAARDGVEALMRIQRELPRAAVIDTALPKMYGFEICEFLKRNESLRGIRVVLVASDNGKTRYKRNPENLYGADDYIEIQDIPHALIGILRRLLSEPSTEGLAASQAARAAQAAPAPEVEEESSLVIERPSAAPRREAIRPAVAARPEPAVVADDRPDPEREKARRLARIIVSDIALYNEQVIQEGIRTGRVLEMLRDDLEEGYRLFRSRVPARIAEEGDYVGEAMTALIEKRRGRQGARAAGPAAPASGANAFGEPMPEAGVDDDAF